LKPTLLVFARAPAIGVGKTRLARDVGRVEAWRVSRAMTADLLRRLRDRRWGLVVRVAPDRARFPGFRVEPQGPGDLGLKLQRALRDHARGPVAVIGTDAPDVTPARVWRALRAARRTGAAIGPATDGGFWLLALSAHRARRAAFPGVRWSTDQACADAIAALGGGFVRLETLTDVDDLASLRSVRRSPYRPRSSAAEGANSEPDASPP
jgi:glycosyltransferase A (GT-A) superfamily protein (DUF2064 family)